jgi:hypothetical protein
MKVKVELVIDVDPAAWVEQNGCDPAKVRHDIKSYIRANVSNLPLLDEADAEVSVR